MNQKTANDVHFEGIIPPLVTPFTHDGSVDEDGLRAVIRYVVGGGVHGVFIAGSTGEAYALSDDQLLRALEIALDEINGEVPVFVGTGRVTTAESVRITRAVESAGADAISVVTPYFITPSQSELCDHYAAIAGATRLPILLYNNPGRTGVVIEPESIRRLAQIDNIVGIKDSSGNMGKMVETLRICPSDFGVFCGFDMIIFNTLCAGGVGAVPASGNIAPRLIVDLYDHFRSNRFEEARRLQEKLAPLRSAFGLGTFPAVLKEGLNLLGIPVGLPLFPVRPLTTEAREALRATLQELSLKPVDV
ncbi:MAG: 4-hydroxy-tetrahydrodipicolinate synthase [Spirochaetales bacterium]|nr:4-hydroxy-tetrahydrodipicolinate synthase [Spirochaetales bacterium]